MNYIKTTILLASLTALLVFCGDALGGRQGAIIGLVFAAVINFGSYWYSDKIILRIYKAREVSEETDSQLISIVRNLAASAELPMPKVYVMDNPVPNAFATGRNPAHAAVAVTTGLRDLLTIDELIGVMAHELSHVKNRDILISTVAATIAGAISYMAQMAMWASMFGGRDNRGTHPAVLIFMMILAPIAAMVIQMAVSRSREYAADRGGALMAGSPLYLAEALKKLEYYNKKAPLQKVNDATAHLFIVSPLGGRGTKGGTMRKLFSTHPATEERVRRLKAMAGII